MIYCVSEVIEMGIKCYLNQEKGVFHNMKRWRKISQVRRYLSCALVGEELGVHWTKIRDFVKTISGRKDFKNYPFLLYLFWAFS